MVGRNAKKAGAPFGNPRWATARLAV
jgi:hypothetical protein